jgi:hypothetical protein
MEEGRKDEQTLNVQRSTLNAEWREKSGRWEEGLRDDKTTGQRAEKLKG